MERLQRLSHEVERSIIEAEESLNWSMAGGDYIPDKVLYAATKSIYETEEKNVSDLIPAAKISTDSDDKRLQSRMNIFDTLSKTLKNYEDETTDAYDCLCWSSAGDAEASLITDSMLVKANKDMHESPVAATKEFNPFLNFSKRFIDWSYAPIRKSNQFFKNLSMRSGHVYDHNDENDIEAGTDNYPCVSLENKYTITFSEQPKVETKVVDAKPEASSSSTKRNQHNLTFISSVLKDPDFKAVSMHCNLAPCYGELIEGSAISDMDIALQKTLENSEATLSAMCKETPISLDFDKMIEVIAKNKKIVSDENSFIYKKESFSKSNRPIIIPGSAPKTNCNDLCSWFTSWVADDDIIRDSKIDMRPFLRTFCKNKKKDMSVNCKPAFHLNENDEINVYEVGILRYPDMKNPYLKLYKLTVKAWKAKTKVQGYEEVEDGIEIELKSNQFKMNEKYVEKMAKKIRDKAIESSKALWKH